MARAPSVWMHFKDAFPGDIIRNEILVPKDGFVLDTYYCTMSWNGGMEGGGYCGLQDHPKGKAFIYSIWDPKQTKSIPIKAAYKGLWTEVANFGGEGTGLRSLNFSIGWKPDQWYTLVSRVWDVNGHTFFGFWIHDQTDHHWSHMITMDFPVKQVRFNSDTSLFLEDWVGTGQNARKGHYRQGFKRKVDGSWFPFTKTSFSVVVESSTHNHANNYDAGVEKDYLYMASGGHVHTSPGIGLHANLELPSHHASPPDPPISFSITKAKPDVVEWQVLASSTPQFHYSIVRNGTQIASGTDTERRSHPIHGARAGDTLEIHLEDILGKTSTKSVKISA
ncbi:uncharacterized protein LOC124150990 [Haliotis rufescens]|uniref:uncharacterized protein LOC124150990 n=1 Tax=Haliotis rufescens TaxID=6454 RepID=UPI00201FB323|nr:uncharacterized protein LOC124150990 [Haliotis rufescens]